MREMKFRAWEKNLKEIILVDNIDFEKKMINTDSAWRLFDEVELMQYTGLKDKNDKEIYEGDIVLYDRNVHPSIDKLHYVVEWGTNGYVLNGYHNDFDNFGSEMLEVVGNIYENPELLGGF